MWPKFNYTETSEIKLVQGVNRQMYVSTEHQNRYLNISCQGNSQRYFKIAADVNKI